MVKTIWQTAPDAGRLAHTPNLWRSGASSGILLFSRRIRCGDRESGEGSNMIFTLTEEHVQLRQTVRSFFERTSPEPTVRRLMETPNGFDAKAWTQMAGQLGLHQLAIPERFGGAGYTFVELGLVLEEMGRALVCAPFFSTVVLAANVLLQSS